MNTEEIIKYFKSVGTEYNLKGQARFGIDISRSFGASQPNVRDKAKEIKKILDEEERHNLAINLWDTRYRETMLLAAMIDAPQLVTKSQMDKWVLDINSWDVCDTVCGDLFDKTAFAIEKALDYATRDEEFVKRAGFVLMAWLAVHNKELPNTIFIQFLDVIKNSAQDERNFVRKAVNWALRQIGKSRNKFLYDRAFELSKKLSESENKTEHWIGQNSVTELLKMKKRFE